MDRPCLKRIPQAARDSFAGLVAKLVTSLVQRPGWSSLRSFLVGIRFVLATPPRGGGKHRKALQAWVNTRCGTALSAAPEVLWEAWLKEVGAPPNGMHNDSDGGGWERPYQMPYCPIRCAAKSGRWSGMGRWARPRIYSFLAARPK